jgi:hypothetical protein
MHAYLMWLIRADNYINYNNSNKYNEDDDNDDNKRHQQSKPFDIHQIVEYEFPLIITIVLIISSTFLKSIVLLV